MSQEEMTLYAADVRFQAGHRGRGAKLPKADKLV
jgi:hypothetical protein